MGVDVEVVRDFIYVKELNFHQSEIAQYCRMQHRPSSGTKIGCIVLNVHNARK